MQDLAKEFDNIGHVHMERTLQSLQMPSKLRQIMFSLMSNNSIKLEVYKKCSTAITMRRGVTQGSSLPSTVFNLCQNFVLKQIADADVSSIHGFKIQKKRRKHCNSRFCRRYHHNRQDICQLHQSREHS